MNQTPEQVLKQYWGYDQFREGQAEAMQAVLQDRDVLVLFPTGGGKSLCYQVPALCREGVCLVISPLIALMQDQVRGLKKLGIKAEAIHSGQSYFEIDRLLDNAIYGNVKFIYMSPERLRHPLSIERIKQMNVNLIAVDEAHCISQWGHDFRPAYRLINEIREVLPEVPMMGLTATATREVRDDISEQLQLRSAKIVTRSFERPNLHLVVYHLEDKNSKLIHVLKQVQGSAIVYVRSRNKTSVISRLLNNHEITATAYHAGMEHKDRSAVMQHWMDDKIKVVVATNAFGMGVDKSNVRVVIHLDIPPSLEEYYQEAGRAGRDGESSYCVLMYNKADLLSLEGKMKLEFPETNFISRIYHCLGNFFDLATGSGEGETFDFDLRIFCEQYNLGYQVTQKAMQIIEQSGWIVLTDSFLQPSRVIMEADKEELYTYQIKNRAADAFIKVLLRSYEGLFSGYGKISEQYLASKLKTNPGIVIQYLEQLHADGILEYVPASNSPKITYLKARSTSANFTIDKDLLKFRARQAKARFEAISDFLYKPDCRMQIILKYFGYFMTQRCGKCDRCIEKKVQPDEETYNKFKSIILKYLDTRMPISEVLTFFPSNRKQQVFQVLERMVAEEWISLSNNILELHPSKRN
jgi:ATP-dependent DNA helicase RecQ